MDKFKEHNEKLLQNIDVLMEYPSIESERNVYLELENAVFLMPVVIENKEDMTILEGRVVRVTPGSNLRVAQFNDEEGASLYPAFTSMDEVDKWEVDLEQNDIYLLEMDMHSYMEMLSENESADGFVIDPFHYNLVIRNRHLARYQEILQEEKDREMLRNPMSRMMDELRDHPSADLEEKIYNAFASFRFLMPVIIPNEEDLESVTEEQVATIKEDGEMQVIPLENEAREKVFPAFTDLYEVNKAGIDLAAKEHYLIEMTFERFEALIETSEGVSGFAINPFTHNVVIEAPQFAHYHELLLEEEQRQENARLAAEEEAIENLEDAEAYQIKKGVHNEELEKVLSKEMDAQGNVHRAYLLEKEYLDKTHYLVVMDKERDGKSILGDLRDAAYPVLPDKESLEFLSYTEPEAQEYVKDVTPFYEKSQKRGIFGLFKGKK